VLKFTPAWHDELLIELRARDIQVHMGRTSAAVFSACLAVACGADASGGAQGIENGGAAGAAAAGASNASGGVTSGGAGGASGNGFGGVTSAGGGTAGAPSSGGMTTIGAGGNAAGGAMSSGGATTNGGGAGGAPSSGGASGASDGGVSGAAQGGAGGASMDDRCDVAVAVPGMTPGVLPMSGDLGTHDPCVIEESGVVYELNTGPLLPGKTSTDLAAWRSAPSAFSKNPAWIASKIPSATDLWAPDLSYFGGQFHLYYAASSFGSNTSCIGHATRAHMNSGAWADQGSVMCSSKSDDFNAIDPNVILDTDGTPWLAFGSFWSGIKIVKLDMNGVRADNQIHSIASRNGGAIEASFIVRRCGYFYLFVSFDKCCAGAMSTYNIRVGRSATLLGPYVDASGKQMMDGGGTIVVQGGGDYAAAGGSGVLFRDTKAYNVFHAYPKDNSAARLRVAELVWDDKGWPISGGP
jgi:arabinan endo-1,5-alpha-L-arabinosidase